MLPSLSKIHGYFSQHLLLSHISHIGLGFGLAILLQHYLKGNSFLPALVGWAFVGLWVVTHVIAYMS